MERIIFDIKRFAIHDGPGIRTTVFFKGCPLNCFWCHNPESRNQGMECYESEDKKRTIGWEISASELLNEIMKDEVFYDHSGGGVTFSGGEPLMQTEFLGEILSMCKENGIHTVVDTSGFTGQTNLESILNLTDLFLFDLKMADDEKHRRYTGVTNQKLIRNLYWLDQMKVDLVIRIPLLPGYNDGEEDLNGFLKILGNLIQKPVLHVLPYHKTGQNKYRKYGLKTPEFAVNPPLTQQINRVVEFFEKQAFEVHLGG